MPNDAGGVVDPLKPLSVREVAERVGYPPRTIRSLIELGQFPDPINPALSKRSWRWAVEEIDAYRRNQWKPDAA